MGQAYQEASVRLSDVKALLSILANRYADTTHYTSDFQSYNLHQRSSFRK